MKEDDPVVLEIPLFLSQALTDNLYIYQYPVRPANRDWVNVKVKGASVKPKNEMVRLEVRLDTYSDRYCCSKGEQIALNTDGPQEPRYSKDKEKEKSKYFKHGIMDKIVYESSGPCSENKNYAVCILQDKEFHCTALQGIVQLRPSYSYHDKQDKRKIDKNKADAVDKEEPEAQQVTVRFARQETEVAKKAREKSYETMSQRISEEPWYNAQWRHSRSDQSELERLKLFSANTSDGSTLTLRPKEYMRALIPPHEEDVMIPKKKVSLQDQVKELLLNAKLLTFNEIRSLLKVPETSVDEALLLTALSGTACCVRGLWAARSDATPARPAHAAARDHVLYLLTQHSYIDRRKVTAAVRLPPQEVLEIIQSVAKYNPNTGWELLIPPDIAFEEKYPDVIKRQNLYWEARQRLFTESLMGESVPKHQRKKSQRDSVSSDSMMSPKQRCNSVNEEDNDRRHPKNKSTPGSGKRTRHSSVSKLTDK